MKLSSKAKTLEKLQNKLKNAKVLPLVRFSVINFKKNENEILENILENFKSDLIVRSSSVNEDNSKTSNAGCFISVLNVKPSKNAIEKAIKKVINSYKSPNKDDEIFIQPMLEDVQICGVIFTADIDNLASYYIINYDESGKTDIVTSGTLSDTKTYICLKSYKHIKNKKLKKLIYAAKECENIFKNPFLDIEFAFSKNELYILQVRAIVIQNKENLSTINLEKNLEKIYSKFKKLNAPHPKLMGDESIFGVMPDWNPAEIIGIKPKNLAFSLYKELITDAIWAYQRDNYGYKNLRSYPLLISFLGLAYIDVRVSFNSFIPKVLDDQIAKKLVNYYISTLKENKNYHDKVEFEIVYSCYYFGIEKKLQKLKEKNFNEQEIKRIEFALLELTNNLLKPNGVFYQDLQKIELLKAKFDEVINSSLSTIDKIYWLNEDCKRYGTLPFAGLARAAFIAVQFLNSLVDEKILSKDDFDCFTNSLNTVSKKLTADLSKLNKKEFLKIYGHLRPGTYDITSLRYDEAYEKYFSDPAKTKDEKIFKFSKIQKEKIQNLLIEYGIKADFKSFIDFIKNAIEAREYSKFLFTRHLSEILVSIEKLGKRFEISKEELAFLDFKIIKKLYSVLEVSDLEQILKENIIKNKLAYQVTKALRLPALITNEEDIYNFFLEKEEPNYITQKKVLGKIASLDEKNLKNKIVCIKSADPGYDFLFSKNIAGLITCYGGANSHMAIRCAELGLVAIIGAGESLFDKLLGANMVEINAALKNVKIIS